MRTPASRIPLLAVFLLTLGTSACEGSGGYEIVDRSTMTLALAAPSMSDTLPSIADVGDVVPYPCARILAGAEARWHGDTLLVLQREESAGGRRRARVFCVPYNAPARTQGVERTSRVYPADPHGEQPGYHGWMIADSGSV